MSRKSFLLRIEQKLYEELEAWAQQEMRSVNGQIEFLLKQSISKRRGTPHGALETTKEESEESKNRQS